MEQPPIAPEERHITEIHGLGIVDNYFWMRNKDDPRVIPYLEAENKYADTMMTHTSELQSKLFEEMKMRMKEDDSSVPLQFGEYYYYSRDEKGKNYKIYARKHQSLDNEEEILLDLNQLAEGKDYLRLGFLDWTDDHQKIVYSLDFSGYENFQVYIKNTETHEVMETPIKNSGPTIRFNRSGSKIYYLERDEINRLSRLKVYNLSSTEYITLFHEDDVEYMLYLYPSTDRKFLFLKSNHRETDKIYFINLDENDENLIQFNTPEIDVEYVMDHYDGYFYFKTTHSALNGKVMKTSIDKTDSQFWEPVKLHDEKVLILSIQIVYGNLVVFSVENALNQIEILSLNTNEWEKIDFSEEIYDVYPHPRFMNYDSNNNFLRLYYSSPITPETTYDYDFSSKELITKKVDEIKEFETTNYMTKRVYVTARDGEEVPLSLIFKKGMTLNGQNPVLLFGYGSYGYSYETAFVSNNISLLDRGIIIGIAHIRGGTEKGKLWYHNGRMFKKKNTFYDFIDCAKYLIESNYTNPEKLGITGGSAGGLLMGACVNFAPELFKVVLARVPFVDVIQTMLDETIPLTTFEWTEWGNPKKIDEFEYMYSYSPYDNVVAKEYPNILITTGLNDPRVAYWEPAKWAAKLRKLKQDDNTLLLKTNMGAGHGGASGRYDFIKEKAYQYAFILDKLGISQ